MLWIAVHLPQLALDALLRGASSSTDPVGQGPIAADPGPIAAVDAHHVLAVNGTAHAAGIRSGLALSAAYAICPALDARRRDPLAEADALRAAATWCAQFTPSVSIEGSPDADGAKARSHRPAAGLLLEVSGSLKLFRGLDNIRRGIAAGLDALGLASTIATSPTARGAWWLAVTGRDADVGTQADLRRAVARLPLDALEADERTRAMLEAIGMRTLGDVIALPRDGFARRFGQPLLDALDEALGRRAESHAFFVPPERFLSRLELPSIVENAEALVFAFRRLFVELEGFLRARNGAASRLDLVFRHEDVPDTHLTLGLVEPGHSSDHFTLLARERFTRLDLAAPVRAIALAAADIVHFAQANLVLFEDAVASASDWARLVERLRARLGHEAVHAVGMVAEHRPEYVATRVEPGPSRGAANPPGTNRARSPGANAAARRATQDAPREAGRNDLPAAPVFGKRPLWLLARPQPLAEIDAQPHWRASEGSGNAASMSPLVLLAGPERIESGWWDDDDVARDYFVARAADQSLLWIYRERRGPGGWFLHGLFS